MSDWNINIGKSFSLDDIDLVSKEGDENAPLLIDPEREVRELADNLEWYPHLWETRKEEVFFWEEIIEHYDLKVSMDLQQVFEYIKQYE